MQAYFENRCKRIDERQTEDPSSCYPHYFATDITVKGFIDAHSDLSPGESRKDVEIRVAGRLMRKHEGGAKLIFYDLHSDGVHIQVFATAADYPSLEDFHAIHSDLRRGDIVGVRGYPIRTKTGELRYHLARSLRSPRVLVLVE